MRSQHRGDIRPEICGVVEVLDIGAVDTEHAIHSERRKTPDDVVDCPVLGIFSP